MNGTYAGTDGHDLQVRLQEFNLDGSPSAKPAPQPRGDGCSSSADTRPGDRCDAQRSPVRVS